MNRRLASICFALVLTFGMSGSALAVDPRTDPVTTGNPGPPTDPVVGFDQPWWGGTFHAPPQPPPIEVETTGAALVGTYVGPAGSRTYIPAFQYQLLYSDPQGGYSCTAYSMAMAIDKATYGGTRVTGREVRALSGVVSYAGMTLADARIASAKLRVALVRANGTWANVVAVLKARRGVILQGVYSMVPVALRGQVSFLGRHAIYVDHLRSDGLFAYVMDPLSRSGGRWWPAKVLRSFAEKLGRETGIYPLVYFSYTRMTRLFR